VEVAELQQRGGQISGVKLAGEAGEVLTADRYVLALGSYSRCSPAGAGPAGVSGQGLFADGAAGGRSARRARP
jgi:hypothetical protein